MRGALEQSDARIVLLGMGAQENGAHFARKLRLDLEEWPIVTSEAPDFAIYQALGLRNESSLAQLYMRTVNAQTIISALRGLLSGGPPTYNSGGSLTQLGGTFILAPSQTELQNPAVLYSHVDTHTGVHAPVEDITRALEIHRFGG